MKHTIDRHLPAMPPSLAEQLVASGHADGVATVVSTYERAIRLYESGNAADDSLDAFCELMLDLDCEVRAPAWSDWHTACMGSLGLLILQTSLTGDGPLVRWLPGHEPARIDRNEALAAIVAALRAGDIDGAACIRLSLLQSGMLDDAIDHALITMGEA